LEHSGEIDLVAFDVEEHLPLLRRWLTQHHVRRWWGDPSVPLVGMCTSVENTSAIRAFEKVGFSLVREYADPECGRCWFMVVRPRQVAA
jgi:RimJ/RimL family protein N-acetyltransferase